MPGGAAERAGDAITAAKEFAGEITLTVDGQPQKLWTTALTVDDALKQLDVAADVHVSASRSQRLPLDGAALDVLTVEPPKNGNILLDPTIPNLIITPHISCDDGEHYIDISLNLWFENLQRFLAGKPLGMLTALIAVLATGAAVARRRALTASASSPGASGGAATFGFNVRSSSSRIVRTRASEAVGRSPSASSQAWSNASSASSVTARVTTTSGACCSQSSTTRSAILPALPPRLSAVVSTMCRCQPRCWRRWIHRSAARPRSITRSART